MAIQTYSVLTPRIGKQRGQVLKHAVPRMSLSMTGEQMPMQEQMSDTVVFRRYLPIGATASDQNKWEMNPTDYEVQEGVTPDARTINKYDVTVVIKEYAILYQFTNKNKIFYEDGIPDQMKKQTGEAMGLLKEKIQQSKLRACTNQYFAGGTDRSTVSAKLTLNLIRSIQQTLQNNRADNITSVLTATPDYGTSPVEAGFIFFGHTFFGSDVRDLPGFTKVVEYAGSTKPIHPQEIGAVENIRFILTPEYDFYINAGAAVGGSGLKSTGGSNIDVYQFFVMAASAWADIATRGMYALNEIMIAPASSVADPIGQRGFCGASFWSAPFIQNDGWMAVGYAGITNLTY